MRFKRKRHGSTKKLQRHGERLQSPSMLHPSFVCVCVLCLGLFVSCTLIVRAQREKLRERQSAHRAMNERRVVAEEKAQTKRSQTLIRSHKVEVCAGVCAH
jgi:hypothetical protein